MNQQNYSNYKKYYPPHHFILLPLLLIACGVAFYKSYAAEAGRLAWLLFGIACFFMLYTSTMLRQHYALGNQDRIIRLEFRLRYFELYNSSSKEIEKQLSFGQIAALRFADDEEFKTLLHRAIEEKLSPDTIKRAIKDWQADNMRV